ncbi:hypothetical protein NQ318_017149 [Aromia moschata]|uniref:RNase H type-1 domain-containing protein n=1 Tax=Aromia moschata TaxID=1265417 RepID=A0AAV8Y0S5_9CUCU|nr:hypothetical protein NQ318_017149 [Aromia moschata]
MGKIGALPFSSHDVVNDYIWFFIYFLNQNGGQNLGNYATLFQAEITAISACAQEMTRRSYTNKRIQIISDSQTALKALGAVEIHSQVVKDCMDSLTKLAEHNSITLKWMRGHQGHVGNERADFLKERRVPLIGPEPTCGLAYRTARRLMKDLLREKHISHWAKVPGLRHSRMFIGEPSWNKSKDFIKLGRNQLRWIVGMFTGHCPLMRHLTTIGVKNDPDCRRCGEGGRNLPPHIMRMPGAGSCQKYYNT